MSGLSFLHEGTAACAGMPVDTFFPSDGAGVLNAIRICQTCPLRRPCLEYALQNPETGIWGGTSHRQRADLARTMGRSYGSVRRSPLAGPPPSKEALARRKYRRVA